MLLLRAIGFLSEIVADMLSPSLLSSRNQYCMPGDKGFRGVQSPVFLTVIRPLGENFECC